MTEIATALAEWFRVVFVDQFSGWVILGFIAQACFTMRFLVQWLASERARRSVIPVAFWFFSILGGGLLLLYAIQRQDPVIIVGQAFGIVIYSRNLWLIFRERRALAAGTDTTAGQTG